MFVFWRGMKWSLRKISKQFLKRGCSHWNTTHLCRCDTLVITQRVEEVLNDAKWQCHQWHTFVRGHWWQTWVHFTSSVSLLRSWLPELREGKGEGRWEETALFKCPPQRKPFLLATPPNNTVSPPSPWTNMVWLHCLWHQWSLLSFHSVYAFSIQIPGFAVAFPLDFEYATIFPGSNSVPLVTPSLHKQKSKW